MRRKAKTRTARRAKGTTKAKAAPKARRKTKTVSAIPRGYRTVTPQLTVRGAAEAIAFYKRAFGAAELARMSVPGGQGIMHAELRIGDSMVFLADELPDMSGRSPQSLGGITGALHLYVKDVDAAVSRAIAAGAQVRMPPMDMFWGDRYARVGDPFGHEWGLATHQEDLKPAEIGRRAEAFFAQAGPE